MVSNRDGESNPYASPDIDIDHQGEFEGESEDFQYANFWQRYVALFVDSIIQIPILFASIFVIFFVFGLFVKAYNIDFDFNPDDPNTSIIIDLIALLLYVLIGWLYFAFQDSSEAQGSLGKRMTGLRIVDLNGDRISFQKATGRHFAKFLSSIFLIGYLAQLFQEKKQAMHDVMAGTLVIKG